MTPGRIGCALAVLAVLCVLTVFFFPAMQGPYPAIHGPVTALLSMRAASRLRLGIVMVGLSAIRGWAFCVRLSSLPVTSAGFTLSQVKLSGFSAGCASILRC
jgi:hypothetical protein